MAAESIVSAALRRLEGKVALITGAASGIGKCTSRLFSKHGAKIVVAYIQDERGWSLAKQLQSNAAFIHCDVTKEDDIKNAVNATVSLNGKIDIMFNNAGMVGLPKSDILDHDMVEFNLVGTFLGTKHAARVMISDQRGSIINGATVFSTIGGAGMHAYTSSKYGVVGLTRNSAELRQYWPTC